MNKDVLVIYHSFCDDGFGAALAAYLKFGKEATYTGMQYGDQIPNMKDKEVYIFDFSFPPEVLLNPELGAESIIMLDHHVSAFKIWSPWLELTEEEFPSAQHVVLKGNYWVDSITVHFDMNKSGAMLAWEYLHPDTHVPMIIKHIQDNDLWKFEIKNTKNFTMALRSYPQELELWVDILKNTSNIEGYSDFISEGKTLSRFFTNQIDYLLERSRPVEVSIAGTKGLALNASATFSSEMGSVLATKSTTFGLIYSIDGDKVKCSLRSIKDSGCDVSLLCKPFGGGGHKSSAGMVMDIKTFIEEILNINADKRENKKYEISFSI